MNGVSFLISAPILTGMAIKERFFNKEHKRGLSILFGASHDKYYINKKPDENTVPTTPENMLKAMALKLNSKQNLKSKALIIGFMIVLNRAAAYITPERPPAPYNPETDPLIKFVETNPNTSLAIIATLAFGFTTGISYGITSILKDAETFYRFHKVVEKDWVMGDEPPKQTSKSKSKSLERVFGIFAPPAPAPALNQASANQITQNTPKIV